MKLLGIHHQVAAEGAVLLAEASELVLQPSTALFHLECSLQFGEAMHLRKACGFQEQTMSQVHYTKTQLLPCLAHVVAQRQRGESHGKSSSRIVRRVMQVQLWLM